MGLAQVIFGRSGRNPSHVVTNAVARGFFIELQRSQFPWSALGQFKHLSVKLNGSGPPGLGNSLTYKLQSNTTNFDGSGSGWTDTGIVTTIADLALENSDSTHVFPTSLGDTMYRMFRSSVGVDLEGTIPQEEWTLTFEAADTVSSSYAFWTENNGTFSPSAKYLGPFSWPSSGTFPFQASGNETYAFDTVPCNGVIDRLDVFLYPTPVDTDDVITFAWVLNNVVQDGSGGTVDTRLNVDGSTPVVNSVLHGLGTSSLPVAILDKLQLQATSLANPTQAYQVWGSFRFRATTPYEYCFTGNTGQSWPVTNGEFGGLVDGNTAQWFVDENIGNTVGLDGFTIRRLIVNVTNQPDTGFGGLLTIQNRKNLADGAMLVQIGLAFQGLDSTHSDAYVTGDYLDFRATGNAELRAENHLNWSAGVEAPNTTPPTTTAFVMRRLRRFPLAFGEHELKTLRRIEFIVQSGVGLGGEVQGSDPQLMVRFSRDGGMTWGMERWIPLGKIGEYFTRAYLTQLGQGRNWVCEVVITDPVFSCLIDCLVDLTSETH